jgi:hypothetical protein
LNHQPEAQHPKSPAIHKLAGRLPHLPNFGTSASEGGSSKGARFAVRFRADRLRRQYIGQAVLYSGKKEGYPAAVANLGIGLGTRTRVSPDAMKKHPSVALRPSSIHGQGLFALRDIPWGVKIIRYSGELINDREANGRIDDGADGIFELAPDENIDGRSKGSLAQFINHDRKAPNCFVLRDSREIWIVAGINGVKRGQELTYDYGPDYF